MEFTRRWFRRNKSIFQQVKAEWAGKPVRYLEIGVFEGASMCWMLRNVLTHPNSRAVGIDPWLMTSKLDGEFMEEVMRRAYRNVREIDPDGKAVLVRANSIEVFQRLLRGKGFFGLGKDCVDIVYVDGSHYDLNVWGDCRFAYWVAKPGGWIIMDDVRQRVPKSNHVREGVALFLSELGEGKLEKTMEGRYAECYRKL